MRHGSDKTLQVGYANHFYRSAHKFEQICRHRLRRQNVGYSNFSQPQSHLSFCVLLQYLVERRRVVTQLRSEERFSRNAETDLVCRLLLEKKNLCAIASECGNSMAGALYLAIWGTRAPVLAEPLLRGTRWGATGGAGNDVASDNLFFFSMRRPPTSTLFPYTTLFRSHLSFCVLLQYLVERRRVVTQL